MGQFEGRRLSWPRLAVLFIGAATAVVTGMSGLHWFQDSQAAARGQAWFAAYVDVATTPRMDFEQPTSAAARHVVLSFVVAEPGNPCQPSWGKDYTLDEAAAELDLDRRVARLRQVDGDVVASFGGVLNDELATVCTDEDRLLEAYASVVDRYDLRTIDLDLEGAALTDADAIDRRAAAIATLQDARAAKDRDLRVWLTLPVAPHGLSDEGTRAVSAMLRAGVDLSGVNVMTMNYGAGRRDGQSMADASIAALNSTHGQLAKIYAAAGKPLGPATLWRRMGATPMIGQNDEAGEVFSLAAAGRLNRFAQDKGLGRLSMWSLNRDRTCGDNYPDIHLVSTSCSGVDQGAQTYARTLRRGLTDTPDQAPVTPNAAETSPARSATDDPSTSPYPIWDRDQTYVEGTRVVWHHNVYVSKWWTTADVPDDPTVDEYSSPWQLVGPVLPGEKPIRPPALPDGTYPAWDPSAIYTKGQRVMFDGMAFRAKWWNQSDSPAARSTQSEPSPWERLSDTEVRRVAAHDD